MKRSAFDDSRDQRIARESQHDSRLMCQASGCPNRWSVSDQPGAGARGLCSAHAWSEPMHWPAITQEQNDAQTDRAVAAARPKVRPPPLTFADKRAILTKLSALTAAWANRDPKAWAHALKAREERGENLNHKQREAWRSALGHTVNRRSDA